MLLRRLFYAVFWPARPGEALALATLLRIGASVVGSILYILSPLDILPEAVLGIIGLLDDLVVLLAMLVYLACLYRAGLAIAGEVHSN